MNPLLQMFIISLLAAFSAGSIAWYCIQASGKITYITLADGRRQERRLPIIFRLLLPLTGNLNQFFSGQRFEKSRNKLSRQLTASGYDGLLSATEFLSIRVLMLLLGGLLLAPIIHFYLNILPGQLGERLRQQELLVDLPLMIYLFMYANFWLKKTFQKRQLAIARALPFVLDLLTLSVEAGLDFMTSIKRIIERRKVDPLAEELIQMFREVQLGTTRRDALKNLSWRCSHADITSLTASLIQADELGTSMGDVLHIQADQMRVRRFQRAEKLAQQAPVKMLFPLVAFIFPAVFVVLLAPVILQFLSVF